MKVLVLSVQPAGASPLHPTPFSLRRQRKGGKRKAGLLRSPARPAAKRVPCGARQGGHAQNSLRSPSALSAQTGCASQITMCACGARPPCLRSSAAQAAINSQQPTAEPLAVEGSQRVDVRYSAVRSPTPSAPPRSTASRPACRRHASLLARPACLSRVSGANAASSGRGRLASTAGNPSPQARGERSAGPPFFSPLFFGGAKKRGPGAGPEVLLRGPGADSPRTGCTA